MQQYVASTAQATIGLHINIGLSKQFASKETRSQYEATKATLASLLSLALASLAAAPALLAFASLYPFSFLSPLLFIP